MEGPSSMGKEKAKIQWPLSFLKMTLTLQELFLQASSVFNLKRPILGGYHLTHLQFLKLAGKGGTPRISKISLS